MFMYDNRARVNPNIAPAKITTAAMLVLNKSRVLGYLHKGKLYPLLNPSGLYTFLIALTNFELCSGLGVVVCDLFIDSLEVTCVIVWEDIEVFLVGSVFPLQAFCEFDEDVPWFILEQPSPTLYFKLLHLPTLQAPTSYTPSSVILSSFLLQLGSLHSSAQTMPIRDYL